MSGMRDEARSDTGKLLIYGASGHGRVVADAARAVGYRVVGWGDGNRELRGAKVAGFEVVAGSVEEAAAWAEEHGAEVVVAVGDNRVRRKLYRDFLDRGARPATVIHPAAVVSPEASIEPGSVLFAGAIVNPGARVGENVILNTAATVDHDGRIGSHAHLSPGVHLGGTVTVGEGTHLGVGTSVRNNVTIGEWSVVGVGSAVVADLPSWVMAYGVPARVVRRLADEA